jgi:uroporphyrin-III C-methyltransferase/precorrin-2 dehydrogenase/sirohydrochlorin ferrochelatase
VKRRLALFLDLEGREVLVVGGGAVGTQRARELASLGARVLVVAPEVSPELSAREASGELAVERRGVVEADVEGVFLVVTATNDPVAQALVFRACEARRTFCLAVDDPAHGSAFGASVLERAPFSIALSSGGEAPALLRLLREVLEQALPPEAWVTRARALRAKWKREATPMAARFPELFDELVRARGEEERPRGAGVA